MQPSETKTTTKCTKFVTCKLYFKKFMVYNYLYTYCLRNWTNSSSHYGVVYVFWKNFLSNPPLLSSRTPNLCHAPASKLPGSIFEIKAVKIVARKFVGKGHLLPSASPPPREIPPGKHPLGKHPLPSACWDTHPLPSACVPPPSACWDTPPSYPLFQLSRKNEPCCEGFK